MKEADWEDCIKNNTARKVTPDRSRAKSLIETAKQRIEVISEINKKNCNFVFEDYYTSIMELLQAKTFIKGYNILNHLCLGYYLREILKREDLYQIFDDLRYKRNSLTYYGKQMEFEVAKQAIEKCKRLFEEIEKISD